MYHAHDILINDPFKTENRSKAATIFTRKVKQTKRYKQLKNKSEWYKTLYLIDEHLIQYHCTNLTFKKEIRCNIHPLYASLEM